MQDYRPTRVDVRNIHPIAPHNSARATITIAHRIGPSPMLSVEKVLCKDLRPWALHPNAAQHLLPFFFVRSLLWHSLSDGLTVVTYGTSPAESAVIRCTSAQPTF